MEEKYEAGLIEGKLNAMKIAIHEIYQRYDLEWLDELTFEQLEKGFKQIFKGLNYEELKKSIIKNT